LPATDRDSIRASYETLAGEFSRVLKRPVRIAIPPDYETLSSLLKAGAIHLGQLSAVLYARGAEERAKAGIGTEVVVQRRVKKSEPYRGAIIVAKKNKAKSIKKLKKKKIAYVDHASSSGYYFPRKKMESLGIKPDKFFGKATFEGSHKKVVEAVVSGKAKVGCVSESMVRSDSRVRILELTQDIPDDAIVSYGSLSPVELKALKNFLLGAHELERLKPFFNGRGIERYVEPDLSVYGALAK
jgi:phosphonate transport system substrate-binding protein